MFQNVYFLAIFCFVIWCLITHTTLCLREIMIERGREFVMTPLGGGSEDVLLTASLERISPCSTKLFERRIYKAQNYILENWGKNFRPKIPTKKSFWSKKIFNFFLFSRKHIFVSFKIFYIIFVQKKGENDMPFYKNLLENSLTGM